MIVQSPNFFGIVEDVKAAAEIAHKHGALLVVVFTEAVSLGLLEPPRRRRHRCRRTAVVSRSPRATADPSPAIIATQGKVHPADARPAGGRDHGFATATAHSA